MTSNHASMRRALTVLAVAGALLVTAAPSHAVTATASPVPGRYCKAADIGKVVKSPKYGRVKCVRDGERARWKQV